VPVYTSQTSRIVGLDIRHNQVAKSHARVEDGSTAAEILLSSVQNARQQQQLMKSLCSPVNRQLTPTSILWRGELNDVKFPRLMLLAFKYFAILTMSMPLQIGFFPRVGEILLSAAILLRF